MKSKPKEYFTGVCPVCGRRVGTNEGGEINAHRSPKHYDRMPRSCWGSKRMAVDGTIQKDDTVPSYGFVWGQ